MPATAVAVRLSRRDERARPLETDPNPHWWGTSARRSVSRVLSRPASRRIRDGHPSGAAGRPTAHAADPRAGQRTSPRRRLPVRGLRPPIWPCSGWSLPRFTRRRLAPPAGIVTVALVLASRRTGVTRHPALRSSDFPHADAVAPPRARPSDRLAGARRIVRRSGVSARPRPPQAPDAGHHRRRAARSPGRWPRWPARRQPCSARAARAPPSSGRSPTERPRAADQSGMSLASLTRQRPASCSTMSFEIEQQVDLHGAQLARGSSARTTPVYSATLLVWMPR